jgi:DNA polymerase-3 subunit beta
MRFTIAAGVLAGACKRLKPVVERNAKIPILANLLVEAPEGDGGRGSVRLTATDLDLVMTVAVEAEVGRADKDAVRAVTVGAHVLESFAGKLDRAAMVSVEMTAGEDGWGDMLKLVSGRSRLALVTLPAADFPQSQAFEDGAAFELSAGDLGALLATGFAASGEDARYYLQGIYLHLAPPPSPGPSPRGGGEQEAARGIRAVATDGHRLARVDRVCDVGEGLPGVIVPAKAVRIAAALAAEHAGDEGGGTVGVAVSAARVSFTFPAQAGGSGDRLVSKTIDGTFPDYEKVIPPVGPGGNANVVTADRAALMAALERVALMSAGGGRAVKLSASQGVLRLEARSPEAGEASDEIDAVYDGPGLPESQSSGEDPRIEIGFNAKYLAETLRQLAGAQVAIAIADAGSPAVFTGEDPGALYVVMPLRV